MLKDLLDDVLPDLPADLGKKLLRDLEDAAETIAVAEGAKLMARALVKGIDAFAAVAVRNLAPDQSEALVDAYVLRLQEQFDQLVDATALYAPLALDVESKKERFGTKSAEANAARKAREAGILGVRQEVKDLLLAAIGDEPAD